MDKDLAQELLHLSLNQIYRIEDEEKKLNLERLYRGFCYCYLFGALELFDEKKLDFDFSKNTRNLTVKEIMDEINAFASLNSISKEELKKAMTNFNTKIMENRKKRGIK